MRKPIVFALLIVGVLSVALLAVVFAWAQGPTATLPPPTRARLAATAIRSASRKS
jgi:hypothetical protein